MRKAFKHRLFTILLLINIGLLLLWVLALLWTPFSVSRISTSSKEWLLFIAFLLGLFASGSNLLYNFRLLRSYRSSSNTQVLYSRTLSIVLLCIYALFITFCIIFFCKEMYEIIKPKNYNTYYGPTLWLLLEYMALLTTTGVWIIILQIKLLRLLQHIQLTKADELLTQLGADSENPR